MDMRLWSCSRSSRDPSSVWLRPVGCDPQLTLVLLDINMPKMDGYQACIEMRAIEKAQDGKGASQIIAVTALGGEAEKRRGLVE
jgi:CheY-like chemotaxis protein